MSEYGARSVEAALAFMETARADATEHTAVSDINTRLMKTARNLCAAAGFDPDDIMIGHAGQEPLKGPQGMVIFHAPFRPAWMLYWGDAVKAVAAVDGADGKPQEAANEGQDAA